MSWSTEAKSWLTPTSLSVASPPAHGEKAPSTAKLQAPKDGKSTIITFLRHCGCPFAEKTFHNLRDTASKHPDVHCIAVSHSDSEATNHWLEAVGGADRVEVIVDAERESYAAWGLGLSSFWHVLSPSSLYSLYNLAKEGITNRPTESGTRWQSSGSYAINQRGIVKWGQPAAGAEEVPNFEDAVHAVQN